MRIQWKQQVEGCGDRVQSLQLCKHLERETILTALCKFYMFPQHVDPKCVFYTLRYELHSLVLHRRASFSGFMLPKQLSGNQINPMNVKLRMYIQSFIYHFFVSLNHLSNTIWQHTIYSVNVFFWEKKLHLLQGTSVHYNSCGKNNYSLFAPLRRHFLLIPAIHSIILESIFKFH